MDSNAQFEQWCFDRTADDPRVLAFREVLAVLPEVPDRVHPALSKPKFINGKAQAELPSDGWDGETI